MGQACRPAVGTPKTAHRTNHNDTSNRTNSANCTVPSVQRAQTVPYQAHQAHQAYQAYTVPTIRTRGSELRGIICSYALAMLSLPECILILAKAKVIANDEMQEFSRPAQP